MVLNQSHYAAFSIANALAKFQITIAETSTKDICNDSRDIKHGDIFAAVTGTHLDGNQYIATAIAQGASLVLSQCKYKHEHGLVEYIQLEQCKIAKISFYQLDKKLASVSAYYYGNPSESFNVTGVTGTNGKTSCCQIIAQLFNNLQQPTGIIGTLGAGTLNNLIELNNTTPGPTKLQQLFAMFHADNVKQVAMEVSSHALSQKRINSDMIDIAVFTNLSRDHLDYHGDMKQYAAAKKQLFVANTKQIHILNGDDDIANQWLNEESTTNRTVIYSCNELLLEQPIEHEYLVATNIVCHQKGVSFKVKSSWGQCIVNSSLLGEFNVSNLLAAMGVLLVQGVALNDIVQFTHMLSPVAGRMEAFTANGKATSVVDYAHTPDGLEKALQSVKAHCKESVWLVFGCGGDRDKGKRPMMGAIAEQYADQIIVTNDNPRTEPAQQICDDILAGITQTSKAQVIIEREDAVLFALQHAKERDMILCAGKGHEDYTIIGTEKVNYNERQIVANYYGIELSGRGDKL